jgi:hypothetical protein
LNVFGQFSKDAVMFPNGSAAPVFDKILAASHFISIRHELTYDA